MRKILESNVDILFADATFTNACIYSKNKKKRSDLNAKCLYAWDTFLLLYWNRFSNWNHLEVSKRDLNVNFDCTIELFNAIDNKCVCCLYVVHRAHLHPLKVSVTWVHRSTCSKIFQIYHRYANWLWYLFCSLYKPNFNAQHNNKCR